MNSTAAIEIEKKVYKASGFSTPKTDDYALQKLMKNVILTAQWFGLFPVEGVTKQVKNVKFEPTALKFVYSIFTLVACTIYTVFVVISNEIDIENLLSIVNIVWNTRAILILMTYIKVGRKWPQLLRHWSKMETGMLGYEPLVNLKKRVTNLSIIFVLLGIIQYIIFIVAKFYEIGQEAAENGNILVSYYLNTHHEFFNVASFNIIGVAFVQFQTLISTFGWQFNDLFIILLTSSLAERFRQINNRLRKNQFLGRKQWHEIRLQYSELSSLCKNMNVVISENVLIAILGNTLYLSVFIFQSLKNRTMLDAIYFWYKILFVLFHFLTVCMYLSWISEENSSMVSILFDKGPKQSYYEINCLMQQCAINNNGVNACGLFKVRRSIILDVAGIMVTIQLIYFQFYNEISVSP